MNYHLQLFDQLISNKEEENEEASAIIADIKETAFALRSEQEIRLFMDHIKKMGICDFRRTTFLI